MKKENSRKEEQEHGGEKENGGVQNPTLVRWSPHFPVGAEGVRHVGQPGLVEDVC